MRLAWFARFYARWSAWKQVLLDWVRASAAWRAACPAPAPASPVAGAGAAPAQEKARLRVNDGTATDALLPTGIDALLRGALVAVLALLAARWWRDRPRATVAQAGSLLSRWACRWPRWAPHRSFAPRWARWAWQHRQGLANGNAVLFALFARALFDDDARWRPWARGRLAGGDRAGGRALAPAAGPRGDSRAVALAARHQPGQRPWAGCPARVAWVVGEALADWRGDLVEPPPLAALVRGRGWQRRHAGHAVAALALPARPASRPAGPARTRCNSCWPPPCP
ncbi:MAG: hypothetical protein U1F53_05275 [Burkholderiaceae bacterium]